MTGRHAFRAQRAFDGDGVLPNGAVVLVEDATIVGVEPASFAVPDGWQVHDEPDTTLLPGLIDAHTHLCCDSGPRALEQLGDVDDDTLDAIVAESLAVELAAGVTTVRDLGDARWAVVDRRPSAGPRVLAAGPPITSPQGHCWNMGGEAAGVDALRAAVRERAEHGADAVKIMASGGIMTTTTDPLAPQFTAIEMSAVVDEAHRHGLPVTAHAHSLAAVVCALDAAVDGIEHCSCMTAAGAGAPADILDRLAAAGTVVCPTLGTMPGAAPPPRVLEFMERHGLSLADRTAHVGRLASAGVRLVSGSDSGINPAKGHGLLPHSIAELIDCGFAATQALATATGLAADALSLTGMTGRLRPGLSADLLIVDGDPATDVADLARVRTVVARGVVTSVR